jgi:hypothetical protein
MIKPPEKAVWVVGVSVSKSFSPDCFTLLQTLLGQPLMSASPKEFIYATARKEEKWAADRQMFVISF